MIIQKSKDHLVHPESSGEHVLPKDTNPHDPPRAENTLALPRNDEPESHPKPSSDQILPESAPRDMQEGNLPRAIGDNPETLTRNVAGNIPGSAPPSIPASNPVSEDDFKRHKELEKLPAKEQEAQIHQQPQLQQEIGKPNSDAEPPHIEKEKPKNSNSEK